MKKSKRYASVITKVEKNKAYSAIEAVKLVKELSNTKFDETFEVAMNMNLDTKKADQQLRGAIVLPNGTGKSQTVLVLAKGDQAKAAKEAGDDAKAAQIMDDFKKFIKEKEDEYNKLFCNPYNAARYGYIDDVIEPRNTRFRVIRALQQLQTKKVVNPAKKHGNIPL